jgi:hypothetical protein
VAWELSGDYVRAADICDRVIAAVAEDSRYHEVAAGQLARLSSKIGTLELRGAAGTRASVDTDPPQALPARIRVAPGRHRIAVDGASEATHSMIVTVGAGETKTLDARAERAAPGAPAPSVPASSGSSGPPLATTIAFGLAGIGAAVGVIYGLQTLGARNDFDETPTRATRDGFYRSRLIANAGFALAGVAAAVAVVVWVLAPRDRATTARRDGLFQGRLEF